MHKRLVGRLLGAMTALATVTVGLAPARAVVPGTNGRIVFATGCGWKTACPSAAANSEIYVMNPDGSGRTQLTFHPAQDILPSWSPDGSKIAFSSDRDVNYEIYTMNPDGSGLTNITRSRSQDRYSTWSPDGTKMAFMSTRAGNGNFEIWTMNADGSNPFRLTFTANIEDCCPDWSSDGSKIVFSTKRDGNFEIYTMNPDGSNQTNVSRSRSTYDGTPGWSPDARTITFRSTRAGNDIWVMGADGSNPRKVTPGGAFSRTPAFSPDGTRILYVSNRDGNEDVWTIGLDGSNPVNLTRSPGAEFIPDQRAN